MTVLLSDKAILGYEILILIGLVITVFCLRHKNKKAKEMLSLQKDRIREENLDTSLKNSKYEKQLNNEVANNAYDVVYHEEKAPACETEKDYISVQIEEKSALVTKKYMIHVYDQVEIGKDDTNKIILNDAGITEHQLMLIRSERSLFLKNLDTSVPVTLYHQKKSYTLAQEAVLICAKDKINVGNTTLHFTII